MSVKTPKEIPLRIRNGAAILLAAGLALSTAGCGFMVPQATEMQFDGSDGVTVRVGEIVLGNMIAFTGDSPESNLVFGAVNNTGSTQTVTIQFEGSNGQKVTVPVVLPPGPSQHGVGDETLANYSGPAGSLKEIFVQYGNEVGVETHIPMLDADEWSFYKGLNPTN